MTSDPELSFAKKVLTVLLLFLLYYTFDVLMLAFAAVLLAIFLRGLAALLGRVLKIGEKFRVLIVSVGLVLVLAGAIALLAPSVAEQMRHLREELPRSAEAASEYLSSFAWGRAVIEQMPSLDDVRSTVDASGVL